MTVDRIHRRLDDVRAYEAVLTDSWVDRLRAAIRRCPDPSETNWYPLGKPAETFFEQVVQCLFGIARPGPAIVGAEWWMRQQAADSGFFLHFDRDESIRNTVVSPTMSSVLYLSDEGGPTLILDLAPEEPGPPSGGVRVWPRRGRYMTFPGRLAHGAKRGTPATSPRIVFLVNFWAALPDVARQPLRATLRAAAPALAPPEPQPEASEAQGVAQPFPISELLDPAKWPLYAEKLRVTTYSDEHSGS
jgi:hypothetical protein